MASRFAILVGLLALTAFAFAAPTASAANDPLGFCDDEAAVDICVPVCITEPCYAYVCVHRVVNDCVYF